MTRDIRIVALFGSRVMLGAERANLETLATLKDNGCDVLVLMRDDPWPELLEIQNFIEDLGLRTVRVPFLDYPIRGWLWHIARRNPGAFVKANRALARIAKEYGATHIHAFNAFYVASFWWALRRSDLPMVYRAGDKPTLHNAFYRRLWRFILERVSFFVADSNFIRASLVSNGVHESAIDVVYCPPPRRVDVATSSLPTAATGADAFRFIYAGQITRNKGVDILVEAFERVARKHPQAHLLIAGRISDWSGDDWARALRDRTMASAALRTRVHFVGFVENIPDLMRQCHAHVAPSIWDEPYGLVVVEAKQAGRPSIIFPRGGMRELVADGESGFVVEDVSSDGLAAAMERYLYASELASEHGKAALASIDTLGIRDFGERWLEVYRKTKR